MMHKSFRSYVVRERFWILFTTDRGNFSVKVLIFQELK